MKIHYWIKALRLSTLLLSFTSIGIGSIFAQHVGYFNIDIFVLTLITVCILQIVSNFANDYGDAIKKTDNVRVGPLRMVQRGYISLSQMKFAIRMLVVLSIFFGLILLYVVFRETMVYFLIFTFLGFLAIGASIWYTIGKKPYGYMGLGDVSVFLFFGLLGVMGSFFLQTQTIHHYLWLPAITCGCFATAVLNINNMRDYIGDRQHEKKTIPVRIGIKNARIYHVMLIGLGYLCNNLFFIFWFKIIKAHYIFFILLLLLCGHHLYNVTQNTDKALNKILKNMVWIAFAWMIGFGIVLLCYSNV